LRREGSVDADLDWNLMTTKSKTAEPYKPTPRERETVDAYFARRESQKPPPRIKVGGNKDEARLQIDHPDVAIGHVLLMEALGTAQSDFMDGLIKQLVNVGTQGTTTDERGTNFILAMVTGIEPKDQVEAMLAAQMAAVHNATMTFARRLNHVENIPQQDSAERAFNKLARTFAAQVEALKRYRTGGQQKVTVEHVTVNAGGQAIVGNVETPGGRGSSKFKGSTPCTYSCTRHHAARHDRSGAGSGASRRPAEGIGSAGCTEPEVVRLSETETPESTATIPRRRSPCCERSRNWRGPRAACARQSDARYSLGGQGRR